MKLHSWLAAALIVLLLACGGGDTEQTDSDATTAETETQTSEETAAAAADEEDQYFALKEYAGSHILVAYKGAQMAKPSITRTKEEALDKAKVLAEQLMSAPDTFTAMAEAESDGPSAQNGGSLGAWDKGAMVQEFQDAIEKLEVGQVTAEPVETNFGYHVIKRESPRVKYYSWRAFVISHKDARNPPPSVTRTKEEAKALIDEMKERLTAENFDEMIAESDFKEGFPAQTFGENDPLPKELKEPVTSLAIGEISDVSETEFGFFIFKRLRVDRYAGSHILITYKDAQRAKPGVERNKEEALAHAKEVLEEVKASPDQFSELAKKYSDGPSGPRGGDLGSWWRGAMVPAFDKAIAKLEPGEIADEPVESPFGYHIIKREAL